MSPPAKAKMEGFLKQITSGGRSTTDSDRVRAPVVSVASIDSEERQRTETEQLGNEPSTSQGLRQRTTIERERESRRKEFLLKMIEQPLEQGETTVTGELPTAGLGNQQLEQTATTSATPKCLSLGAGDASQAKTPVRFTRPRKFNGKMSHSEWMCAALRSEVNAAFFPMLCGKISQKRIRYWDKKTIALLENESLKKFRLHYATAGLIQSLEVSHIAYNYPTTPGRCVNFFNKRLDLIRSEIYLDRTISTGIDIKDLLQHILSLKLEFLALQSLLKNTVSKKYLTRCQMLRVLLFQIGTELQRKLNFKTNQETHMDELPGYESDDDDNDRRNKWHYNKGMLNVHLQTLMQDSFIQAECQSLFDISVSPNEEGFKRVFENIKEYISEQFGEKLKFCRDIIVNIAILLILWYTISAVTSHWRQQGWTYTFLSVLAGFIVLVCSSAAAGTLGRVVNQIAQFFKPKFDPVRS